ncbi:hypothetical protein [Paenochrobactrum pullorum]|uniref:hypothetical protein n=1 Tax=Paenochrobactrum pullorum TaxID=1324351 RepID=UPI0035BC2820
MPRPAETNKLKNERQKRYRAKLKSNLEPEADRADIALASSVSALVVTLIHDKMGSKSDQIIAQIILKSAVNILISNGYSKEKSIKVLMRRVSLMYRPDIDVFIENAKLIKLLKRYNKIH